MQEFDSILQRATKNIPSAYFSLPIAGRSDAYRERVYTYELYHQIRTIWPEGTQYSLSGEVDKAGCPLIRGGGLSGTKPDMLVHIPGNMGNNYLILEIKPINASKAGIKKDLQTLTAFRRNAGYERAILLVYGGSERQFERFIRKTRDISTRDTENLIDPNLLEIWRHPTCGKQATRITAPSITS